MSEVYVQILDCEIVESSCVSATVTADKSAGGAVVGVEVLSAYQVEVDGNVVWPVAALASVVADMVAAAVVADEQEQADAVDRQIGGPSPEYLAGYRAATARAADVVRELAVESVSTDE